MTTAALWALRATAGGILATGVAVGVMSINPPVQPAHPIKMSVPVVVAGRGVDTVAAPALSPVPPPPTAAAPTTAHPAMPKPARKPPPPKVAAAPTVAPAVTWQSTFAALSARLPGTWIVQDRGAWGATDLNTGTVYIAPRTPLSKLSSVMYHESVHVLQGRVFGGRSGADAGLATYGGIEAVADCGARMLGATWTNYVQHCSAAQNHAASAILRGVKP